MEQNRQRELLIRVIHDSHFLYLFVKNLGKLYPDVLETVLCDA
mgnify:FL=1